MPGYLHHVASRIAGTAPVVKPRLPSRFEPVRAVGPVEAGLVAGEIAEEIPAGVTGLPGRTAEDSRGPLVTGAAIEGSGMPQQPRMAPRAMDTPHVASTPHTDSQSEQHLVPQAARPAPGTQGRRSGLPLGRAEDATSRDEEVPTAMSRRARKAEGHEWEGGRTDSAKDASDGQASAGPTLADLEKVARELLARTPNTSPAAEGGSISAGGRPGSSVSVREPRAETPSAAAPTVTPPFATSSDATRFESSPAKQDIHIVIGRITVHGATASAVALPPAARPTPRMTLEQYLQERGGGR